MAETLEIQKRPVAIFDFSSKAEWTMLHRLLFRFVAAYMIVFNLPYQGHSSLLEAIPGMSVLARPYIRGSRQLIEWVAAHVFHLTGPVATYPRINGSGDTTLDYIHQLSIAVAAVLAALVWSALDRQRPNYRRFHAWLRIFVRYSLALTLFAYGFAKVFPLQFVPASFGRLLEPFNEFSPMGVLWSFMGASAAYTIFSGAAEVTGGLLLLFRRTTTLGALVSAAVLLNVVMLNFCYDVPVKLYSSNLFLMAIFLAAPDLKRLADVFLWNRAARLSHIDDALFRSRGVRMTAIAVKTVFIGYVLFLQVRGGIQGYRNFYTNAPKSPLYGIWNVESFTRAGQPVADGSRWSKIAIERPQFLTVRPIDGPPQTFPTKYDEASRRITLSNGGYLNYTRPDEASLRFDGAIGHDTITVELRRIDPSKFLLTSRGFHWINERPFNR